MIGGSVAGDQRDPVPALRYPKAITGLTCAPTGGPGSATVVTHPAGTRYFRVSTGTLAALAAMDGTRSVEQLSQTLGLSTVRLENLVKYLDSVGLLDNGSENAERRPAYGVADLGLPPWFQRIVFVQFPVLFPDRMVEKIYRAMRLHRFFGAPALILFVSAGIGGLAAILSRPDLVPGGASGAMDPRWSWLVLLLLLAKRPLHELGHVLACRYYGQSVGGVGVGLYFFLPVFYVDASSAWMLPSRRARLWVHLAGFVADLSVLFAALIVAMAFPDWAPAQTAARFLLVTVVVSVVYVLNPMLKLDGYFILCDILGTRNLRERAFGALLTTIRTLLARLGLRVADGAYPTTRSIRGVGLIGYAVAAFAYTGAIIGWAANRLSSWVDDTWDVPPMVPLVPYALAVAIFALFVYFIWRASVTSSYRRF